MTAPSSPSRIINARAHAILRFNHPEEFAQIKRELWRMYDQGYRFPDRSAPRPTRRTEATR